MPVQSHRGVSDKHECNVTSYDRVVKSFVDASGPREVRGNFFRVRLYNLSREFSASGQGTMNDRPKGHAPQSAKARSSWDRTVAGYHVRTRVCDTAQRPGMG